MNEKETNKTEQLEEYKQLMTIVYNVHKELCFKYIEKSKEARKKNNIKKELLYLKLAVKESDDMVQALSFF